MIVDLHAHYAMHLMDEQNPNPLSVLRWARSPSASQPPPPGLPEQGIQRHLRHHRARRHKALTLSLLGLINVMFNYRSITSGPGVTMELMRKGGVRVVLSPLYDPINEFGLVPAWLAFVVVLLVGMVLSLVASVVIAFIGNWVFVVGAPLALVALFLAPKRRAVIMIVLAGLAIALSFIHWGTAGLGPYILGSAIGTGLILAALLVILAFPYDLATILLLASAVVALIGDCVGVAVILLTMLVALVSSNRLAALLLLSSLVVASIVSWIKVNGVGHLGPMMLGSFVSTLALAVILFLAMASYNLLASWLGWSLDELPGSPPRSEYVDNLVQQLEKVERDIEKMGDWAVVARDFNQLESAIKEKKIAIIHAIEGGFQLGGSKEEIECNVASLAQRGVAYVTLAHLFFRGVARNAAAIPFPDWVYHFLARQPQEGLTELGRAAVCAMFRNGILIDVTHMSQRAIDDTFALLEKLEAKYRVPQVPVIATHIACRFGKYEYNLSDDTIMKIGKRNGVMGVIFCDHWMHDGPRKHDPRTERRTFQIVRENIDRIAGIVARIDGGKGSPHRCTAIGSDLDGFIKPMLRGLEDMGCMWNLENYLRTEYSQDITEYSQDVADLILSKNALRVLGSEWGMRRELIPT